MNEVKLKRVLTVLFFIISAVYLYMLVVIDPSNKPLRSALKSVPILILLMLYCFKYKKQTNPLVVSIFVVTVIGDIITNTMGKFFIGIIIYAIAHLFLIKMIYDPLKKEAKKEIMKYFLLGSGLFAIIFIYVLSNMGNSYYPIIFYGLIMSLAFSIILSNYLHKMVKENGLLLTAFGIRVFSDLVYAMTIFNESNVYFDLISLSTFMVSNYIFYRAFILIKDPLEINR